MVLCTASCDGIAYLFDAKSGTLKRTFENHTNEITGLQVVFGKMFTTCSDGKMCVWSISGLKDETVFGSKHAKESQQNEEDCEAVKEAIHVVDYFVHKY
ncbi:WD repeat-containing protein 86-like protein [Leptotrombidium deliense]|uniref:WD repeat-containing protein 86-like protein n=1 Tax=Leptotrombidium deliense TaxID=299467 RepID=A0A443S7Z4_9ACAR|nr:WD repeat-containing protein 86-like protein [Leptotrombidium deliense]